MADWQTLARRAAQQERVPPDLYAALIRQESGGNPNARSPVGAEGYSQLMPDTAKALGVNPRDPWQNLVGGARYLRQQLSTFKGNVSEALAAYNAGPGAVQKYGGIPPYSQTQNYVKSILGSLNGAGAPAGSGHPTSFEAPAAAPASLTGGVSNAGQSADASALISLLSSQRQRAAAGPANLPTPTAVAGPVLPQAYRALSSGQAPAPKADISSLLSLVQTPGQGPASTGAVSDAGAVSAPPAPSGGSKAGPGGFKGSGVLELIHNDGGAGYGIKNGQIVNGGQVFSSVWAGHANHVHVAAGPKTTVELGKLAQSMGLHVSENPHFGGVTQGAHVADSYHYKGEAIDVSGPAAKMNAYARAVEQYNRTHRL